jgi:hypothetical protein
MEEFVTRRSKRGKVIVAASVHLQAEGWEAEGVFVRKAPRQCEGFTMGRSKASSQSGTQYTPYSTFREMYRFVNCSVEPNRRSRPSENDAGCNYVRIA